VVGATLVVARIEVTISCGQAQGLPLPHFWKGEKLPRTADTGGFLNLQLQVGVLRIASGFLKTEACTPQSDERTPNS